MHSHHLALVFAGSVVIGLTGFTAGRLTDATPTSTPASAPFDPGILSASDSFSEVDQARDALGALSMRYITHAQRLMLSTKRPATPDLPGSATGVSAPVPEAVAVLEDAANGFRGTGSEVQITRNLLMALKRERLHSRWVDVYLDLAHRQPMEPMVVELGSQALEIARFTGRTREVTAALEHIAASPGPLAGREALARLLANPSWSPVP
jgi:hypothetical protein